MPRAKALIPIYCDQSFFDYLGSYSVNLIDFSEENLGEIKTRTELLQFILKGAKVYCNIPIEEAEKTTNPIIKYLIKAPNKRFDIHSESSTQQILTQQHLSPYAIFFSNDEFTCNQVETSYGHFCINIKKLQSLNRLFRFQTQPLRANDHLDWSFIRNFCYPLNSMIFCDPYLLSNDLQGKENLCDILQEFLLGSSHATVDITFITCNQPFINNEDPKETRWTLADERLENCWSSFRVHLRNRIGDNLNLSLINVPYKKLHDRFIITNNIMIYSGYGFGGIGFKDNRNNLKVKKQTSWSIINHAKMQESNMPEEEKTHFNTINYFIEDIKEWINIDRTKILYDGEIGDVNKILYSPHPSS